MIHKDTVRLSEQFRNLELHAAHSGRETLRVLIQVLNDSSQTTISGLLTELQENISFLLPSLPSYAPPLHNINHVLLVLENAKARSSSVDELKEDLSELYHDAPDIHGHHQAMAQELSSLLPENARIYTHTLSETVLGILSELHRWRKLSLVTVTESRPNNDGWETARRLVVQGLQVHLAIDAAMPEAIESSDLMISGAEIIQPDGSVVGKVGAYPAAVLCQLYQKPLYVAADTSKFNHIPWKDFCRYGISSDVLGIAFSHPSLHVMGTYFDVTPAHLIRAYITERGAVRAKEIPSVLSGRKVSAWLMDHANNGMNANIQVE